MSQSGFAGKRKDSPFAKSPGRFSSKTNKTTQYLIVAQGYCPEFPIESFAYYKDTKNGRCQGYLLPYKNMIESEDPDNEIPILRDAGFCGYFQQRLSNTRNSVRMGGDDWALYHLVRLVPGCQPSTAVTRQEGMNVLEMFIKDTRYTQYPPKSLTKIDATNQNRPLPLDHAFMDRDVMSVLKIMYDESEINSEYASKWSTHSPYVFSGPLYPNIAINELGYGRSTNTGVVAIQPNGNVAGVANGFTIPRDNATESNSNANAAEVPNDATVPGDNDTESKSIVSNDDKKMPARKTEQRIDIFGEPEEDDNNSNGDGKEDNPFILTQAEEDNEMQNDSDESEEDIEPRKATPKARLTIDLQDSSDSSEEETEEPKDPPKTRRITRKSGR